MAQGLAIRLAFYCSTLLASTVYIAEQPRTAKPVEPLPALQETTQAAAQDAVRESASREFTSDEVLVYGTDADGNPFLLDLSLNRKQQTADEFVHYYIASYVHGGVQGEIQDTFTSSSKQVQPHSLLQRFEHVRAQDLSTQEYYRLQATIAGKAIRVWIPRLQSDFLVRNVPEYTKYVSGADAAVEIDGIRFNAQALVSTIYSTDYSRYLFFPGYGTLQSETNFLVLWDEEKNMYVIDASKVAEGNPAYQSHTWILYKNGQTGVTQKAFEATVSLEQENGKPSRWKIAIPGLANTTIEISAVLPRKANAHEGIAGGTVTAAGRKLSLGGLFYHHVYGAQGVFGA